MISSPSASYMIPCAVCASLRCAIAAWLGALNANGFVLLWLGGGAFVPRLMGTYELFVVVLFLGPAILLTYLYCDYLSSQLGSDALVGMTRIGKRRLWAILGCLQIGAVAACYELLSSALVIAVIPLLFRADSYEFISLATAVLSCTALDGAFLTATLLGANLLSIHIEPLVGFASLVGAHGGALIALTYAPADVSHRLAKWLPSARAIPAWHRRICELLEIQSVVPVEMSVLASASLFLIVALVLAAAIVHSISKIDIV